MTDSSLIPFWIIAPDKHGPLGFGVTAFSLDDALRIIREFGYNLPDDNQPVADHRTSESCRPRPESHRSEYGADSCSGFVVSIREDWSMSISPPNKRFGVVVGPRRSSLAAKQQFLSWGKHWRELGVPLAPAKAWPKAKPSRRAQASPLSRRHRALACQYTNNRSYINVRLTIHETRQAFRVPRRDRRILWPLLAPPQVRRSDIVGFSWAVFPADCLGSCAAAWLGGRLRWIPAPAAKATALGTVIGFLVAAAIAINTLRSRWGQFSVHS